MLSEQDERLLRERHVPFTSPPDQFCHADFYLYPCPTLKALDALADARELATAYRQFAEELSACVVNNGADPLELLKWTVESRARIAAMATKEAGDAE